MSEVNNEVNSAPEEEYVPKKAYKEVTDDMFKYKNKLKETEAMLAQLSAEREAAQVQSLKENEQWKTLYEKNQAQLDQLAATRAAERDQFINYHKKNAVIRELGGFKKDEYNSFINVSNVELDENSNVIPESLIAEVNRLKQTYPELIKGVQANNLPSDAPKSFDLSGKAYGEMTDKERLDLKIKLMLENKKTI